MPDRRFLGRIAVLASAAVIEWLLAVIPAALAATELLLFIAPAALIGLAFAWLASLGRSEGPRLLTVARGAMYGAIFLPPVLAFSVAVAGTGGPGATTSLFVLGAWVTMLFGGTAAVVRVLRGRLAERRRARRNGYGARAIGSAARRRRTY